MDKPVLTGAHALVAARQLLHMADCNPREVDFFNGFDFTAVSTDEMKELRNLICGVLSLRDRRTWSGNGLRTTVNNRNIYLGETLHLSPFLFILTSLECIGHNLLLYT